MKEGRPLTDIIGNGYGSNHNWKLTETPQDNSKRSFYECNDCGRFWCHYYDKQPDIYIAMQEEGMPDRCSAESTEVKNSE